MKRVILELEYMPQSCRHCVLSTKRHEWVCGAFDIMKEIDFYNTENRAEFCPLKIVEVDKYKVIG
jgi:hypothetical protein